MKDLSKSMWKLALEPLKAAYLHSSDTRNFRT